MPNSEAAGTARPARRLRYFTQGAECAVVLDVANGPLASEHFIKLRYDGDVSEIGLPALPQPDSMLTILQ